MTRTTINPWLNRFAVITAAATFVLIGAGGLVTSHEAGMAVPDWPTTYGYNMFLFPPSYWIGGIFYEHTHRLLASMVGLLTAVLAGWLWLKEDRPWLRWLGVAAFFGVILQGVLGGLRVTLFKDQIGIFHAAVAQLFLVVVSLIALFTSQSWQKRQGASGEMTPFSNTGRWLLLMAVLMVLVQLILGASMRHQHAGLAVPDFPLAYGKLWPPTDAPFLDSVNRSRLDVRDQNPITASQVVLHMAHRIGAIFTLIAAGCVALKIKNEFGRATRVFRFALGWFGLIINQAVLGAATVWTQKAADVATAHVILGAASLVVGSVLCAIVLQSPLRFGLALHRTAVLQPMNDEIAETKTMVRSV